MEKIGRNDTCPCMSGKKYKKCCELTGIWSTFKSQGLSYVNERFYFEQVYKDESFRNLYLADRDKLNKQLLCFKSENINASASYGNIEDEAYLILSRHNQPPITESIHMAHEIEHLVLHSIGHKAVSLLEPSLNNSVRTHKMLNDMLYDPLLNKRLISFGFDLPHYLEMSDRIQLGMPNKGDSEFLVKTLFVKRILDYRNLDKDILEDDIPFVIWVKKDYPQVVEDSRNILKIIDEYNVLEPLESDKALKKIISYLNLQDVLTTVYL